MASPTLVTRLREPAAATVLQQLDDLVDAHDSGRVTVSNISELRGIVTGMTHALGQHRFTVEQYLRIAETLR